MEKDATGMRLTIRELEKRRDQAIKEIRSLKHQIHKDKKTQQVNDAAAANSANTGMNNNAPTQ